MIESSQLLLFVLASLVLLIVPGPAVLYIVARSVAQGRKAGLMSIFGLAVGNLVHVFGAALGLSALLLASAYAFNAIKLLGALYLIFLGIRTLMSRSQPSQNEEGNSRSRGAIFLQGIVVNILNPKSALFFFAFLPQFVNPASGSIPVQMILLGLLFIGLGIVTDTMYAMLAGTIGHRFRHNALFLNSQRYFSGVIYILLGIGTAISDTRPK